MASELNRTRSALFFHMEYISSTSILKYFDIRSINSADGVLSPRSILPTVLVLYPIAAARSSENCAKYFSDCTTKDISDIEL